MAESNSSNASSSSSLPEQDLNLQCLRGLTEGDECPLCHAGHIWFNGLLNLVCDHCGFEQGAIYT